MFSTWILPTKQSDDCDYDDEEDDDDNEVVDDDDDCDGVGCCGMMWKASIVNVQFVKAPTLTLETSGYWT